MKHKIKIVLSDGEIFTGFTSTPLKDAVKNVNTTGLIVFDKFIFQASHIKYIECEDDYVGTLDTESTGITIYS